MKKIIHTDHAPAPVGPYSQAILRGDTLFCSGVIPIVPETGEILTGDIQSQAKQVMKNTLEVLKAADMNWSNVTKSMIFLTDLNDFAAVNEIYGEAFPKNPPARSCVQVSALPKGVNVEIEVLAHKD